MPTANFVALDLRHVILSHRLSAASASAHAGLLKFSQSESRTIKCVFSCWSVYERSQFIVRHSGSEAVGQLAG